MWKALVLSTLILPAFANAEVWRWRDSRGHVRDRQRARLEAYANSTLLPDWLVADRWMAVKEEEARLRAALAHLECRRNGLL